MRILIFNWRDLKNPMAGGAELLTQQLAARWVRDGHEVTQFSSAWPGAAPTEELDGVRIVRAGNRWTVYWAAFQAYRCRFQGKVDVVFDEINTVPFFTPWYIREPIILHFNQLAREIWFYECPWPLSWLGRLLESWWLQVYRRVPVVAISESSRRDLVDMGFSPHQVTVVPMGADHTPRLSTVPPRAESPTLLFVGRLKRSKRVEHVLEAFRHVRAQHPLARLWIVGKGDRAYQARLVRQTHAAGLDGAVTFYGHVPELEKQALMAQAHLILVTSVREGWGLIVTEANRYGTPSVVYRVPGLVDSTQDGVNGLVCAENSPSALAGHIHRLLTSPETYAALSRGATASASKMTWDRAARDILEAFRHVGRRPHAETPAAASGGLTIFVPTTEGLTLQPETLRQVVTLAQRWPGASDILIVGDPTARAQVAEELGRLGWSAARTRQAPYDPARGRLCIAPQAVEQAPGDWLLIVDPHIACAPGQLDHMVQAAAAGADIVTVEKTPTAIPRSSWFRRWLHHPWRFLVRWWFGLRVGDFQVRIKFFRLATLRDVVSRIVAKEYTFDLEILAVAHRLGARIVAVPLRLAAPIPWGPLTPRAAIRVAYDMVATAYRMHVLRFYDRPVALGGSEHPRVSVVIAVDRWNPLLAECLARCLTIDYPAYEILVLPDAGFAAPDPRIRVIATGHVSPGAKRNRGAREARGAIIAFLDDDALPTAEWIRRAVRHFRDPTVGAVGGPATTPAHDSWRQQVSGAVYASWMMGGTKSYRYIPYPARAVNDLPTCNLFVRRTSFEAIGGFDQALWPGEDTILCAKITRDLHQRIWYDPEVLVYHHRRAIFREHLRQLRRYAEHRGYFVKRFPSNSLQPGYFLPSCVVAVVTLGWLPGLLWPGWWAAYTALILAYVGCLLLAGLGSFSPRMAVAITAGIFMSNVTYGLFFLKGLWDTRLPEEP